MANVFESLIINMLNGACQELAEELSVLKGQMHLNEGMFITHDRKSTIKVITIMKFKAYIPKKYQGLNVEFIEWTGQDVDLEDL